MNRVEFMSELENLLNDISEEERSEALEFYESYFDEAGADKEEEIIRQLKSPGRVAESIRAGLNGEDRAIYTERGYEEDKSKKEKHEISLKKEPVSSDKVSLQKMEDGREKQEYEKEKNNNRIIGIILLAVTSPIWGGILLGILGGLFGILMGLAGALLGVFAASVVMIIAGIFTVANGCFTLVSVVPEGIFEIGIGLLCFGLGGLLFLGCWWLTTKAVPAVVKWIWKIVKSIFGKKRSE